MEELQIFKNEEFGEIRTVTIKNEPWFVGKDVCEAFGDTNYRRSLSNIDDSDKGVSQIETPGGKQNMVIAVSADTQTVSARELHGKLNIKTAFKDWFPRMIEYGFEEGKDFSSKMGESTGGRPSKEYDISIDMAKQICMIQRTPEGKECRQYLIDLEKAWNTPEQVMARALRIADKTIENLKTQVIEMNSVIQQMQPKVNYVDTILDSKSTVKVTQIAQDYGMSAKAFNKVLSDLGVQHKVSRQWILYSKYQGQGYVHSQTFDITRANGNSDVVMNTEWTQKGRLFLYELLKQNGVLPMIER